jgi:hypothetical protein
MSARVVNVGLLKINAVIHFDRHCQCGTFK